MDRPLPEFFNDISLLGLEGLAELDVEDISSKLNFLEATFAGRIRELKQNSIGNRTRTHLLNSINDVEFIIKVLCQKTIIILVKYLMRKCKEFQWNWNVYINGDHAGEPNKKRLFLSLLKTYTNSMDYAKI